MLTVIEKKIKGKFPESISGIFVIELQHFRVPGNWQAL